MLELRERLGETLKFAPEEVAKSQRRSKFYFDKKNNEDLLELDYVRAGKSVSVIVFGDNLSEDLISCVRSLVSEYSDVFVDVPGSISIKQHRINLTSDQRVRSRPYTVPFGVRESLNRNLVMEKTGIIRKSESA